jgi:hypothetical protein
VRLADGTLSPIAVTLDVSDELANGLERRAWGALRGPQEQTPAGICGEVPRLRGRMLGLHRL